MQPEKPTSTSGNEYAPSIGRGDCHGDKRVLAACVEPSAEHSPVAGRSTVVVSLLTLALVAWAPAAPPATSAVSAQNQIPAPTITEGADHGHVTPLVCCSTTACRICRAGVPDDRNSRNLF